MVSFFTGFVQNPDADVLLTRVQLPGTDWGYEPVTVLRLMSKATSPEGPFTIWVKLKLGSLGAILLGGIHLICRAGGSTGVPGPALPKVQMF